MTDTRKIAPMLRVFCDDDVARRTMVEMARSGCACSAERDSATIPPTDEGGCEWETTHM